MNILVASLDLPSSTRLPFVECLNLVKYYNILLCNANEKHFIFTQKPRNNYFAVSENDQTKNPFR